MTQPLDVFREASRPLAEELKQRLGQRWGIVDSVQEALAAESSQGHRANGRHTGGTRSVVEQSDLPFLVRSDTGRYLRESDVVEDGRDDLFALWDKAQAEVVWAPGSAGSSQQTLELPDRLRPALDVRKEVRLASG